MSVVEMGREGVPQDLIKAYRENGYVKVPNLITPESAAALRQEALGVASGDTRLGDDAYADRLTQQVNVWRSNEVLRQVTMSPGIARVAEQLTGVDLRVWHDHLLSKKPHNEFATEWHQDRPYWPFEQKPKTISVWIALQDTPSDRGCMSFIPGSQTIDNLTPQDLADARSLFNLVPDLEFEQRVTEPLRAGDATFDSGYTAHMATANITDEWRVAHVTIYMDAATTYSGKAHVVTESFKKQVHDLQPGDPLDGEWFPRPVAQGMTQ